MSTEAGSRFFALLALLAFSGGLVAWVGWWRRASWIEAVRPLALPGAWLVAATAMSGSLWYSEVVHFTPCKLCWYQRIGIYPLVALLAVAVVRRRDDVRAYVWALTAVTAPISLYHLALQNFPSLEGSTCDPAAPCSVRWVHEFGIVSIPFMALATVVAVSALVAVAGPERRRRLEGGQDTTFTSTPVPTQSKEDA